MTSTRRENPATEPVTVAGAHEVEGQKLKSGNESGNGCRTPSASRGSVARSKPLGVWAALKSAASLTVRAAEFTFYHVLLTTVDRVSRLPRNSMMPEAARLYRENIALKAQLDALESELARVSEPGPVAMSTRAAQVFAYLLTRVTSRSTATSSRRRWEPSSGGRIASADSGIA